MIICKNSGHAIAYDFPEARKIVLAEKPSIAQSIARVIGANNRRGDGYLEGNGYVVSWCVGHLVELQPFIDDVLPNEDDDEELRTENIDVVIQAEDYLM